MNRKDYIKIAEIISRQPSSIRTELALDFVVMLKEDNEHFNADTFLKACNARQDNTRQDIAFRVTIRGEGTELRGYATPEALAELADIHPDTAVVVASPVREQTSTIDPTNPDDITRMGQ